MWERNDGIGESNYLQNQFTAYLVTAIRRKKLQYLRSKIKLQQYEISLEILDYLHDLPTEQDIAQSLPLLEQFENIKLQQALRQTKQRDLYIFLAKALEGCSFAEIATELGLGYNTVASVYYRLINKLKKELGGESK